MSENDNNQLALQAQQLLREKRSGCLATLSVKHPGFPFASTVNYGVSKNGSPTFLLSSLATHSKNLRANSNVSFLVTTSPDLSSSRLTLVGNVEAIEHDLDVEKQRYLEANPDAAQWISFGDFQLCKLVVVEAYFVAGFGSMGWIKPSDFTAAAK